MRNILSKGILAAALIMAPVTSRGEGLSPATQAANQVNEAVLREHMAQAMLARQAALDNARVAHEKTFEQLAEVRRHVQDLTGLVEVTPESVRQVISRLQEQREELELDKAGAEGRRQALEEAAAALSKQLKDRVRSDSVAVTLEKVVEVRRAQLQRVQELYKQAAIARGEVESAEASLAMAQAEVAAAQQKASGGSAGEPLDAWNRQLLELGIADREREGRLKFINKRLEQLSAAFPALDQMEECRARLAATGSALNASEEDLRQMGEGRFRPGE